MKSTGDELDLVQEVKNGLSSCGVGPHDTIVVGCSGGSDSTALLVLLVESGHRACVCAHFDHGLRGEDEARGEAEQVRGLATRLGVSFEAGAAERGRLSREARSAGASVEERARRARYEFLSRVCRRYGSGFAATGHTQDDQVETIIMRLMQGSDVEGLSGMRPCAPLPFVRNGAAGSPAAEPPAAEAPAAEPPASAPPVAEVSGGALVTLVRPLLGVDRMRLRAYLEAAGIPFVEDPSNADTTFLRNSIRRYIVPHIERVFPAYREGVSQTTSKLAEVAAHLRREAEATLSWQRCSRPQSGRRELCTPRATFFSAPALLQRRALFAAFNELGSSRERIPYRFVESIPRENPSEQRKTLARGHGLVVELDARMIRCRRDIVPRGEHGYLYEVATEHRRAEHRRAQHRGGPVMMDIHSPEEQRRRTFRFPAGAISPPLIVRSRRAGDVVALSAGHRTVKRIFSDYGVPVSVRDAVPILEDRAGIVGVLGEAVGCANVWRRNAAAEDLQSGDPQETAGEVVTISVDINEVTKLYAG